MLPGLTMAQIETKNKQNKCLCILPRSSEYECEEPSVSARTGMVGEPLVVLAVVAGKVMFVIEMEVRGLVCLYQQGVTLLKTC